MCKKVAEQEEIHARAIAEKLAKEKSDRINEQKRRIEKEAADKKRKRRINAKALKIVLEFAEKKRDEVAEEITKLQSASRVSAMLQKFAKKYKSAVIEVTKAQFYITRHEI